MEKPHVVSARHLGSLAAAYMRRLIGAFRAGSSSPGVQEDERHGEQSLQVQALDFSRWLLENIRQDDHVYLQMNAAGAEYLIMEQLIVDGSVLLLDEISIVWHDGTHSFSAEWLQLIEDIVTKLGLQSNNPRHL